jgi:hypothetical protein
LFIELIEGAMALGGGEFTVVSVVDLVVEFEVDSVTIACAQAEVIVQEIAMPAQKFFIIIVV